MADVQPHILLFAALCFGFGLHAILRRTVTFGGEGEDSLRQLTGSKAVALGWILIVAGGALLVKPAVGFTLIAVAVIVPWFIE